MARKNTTAKSPPKPPASDAQQTVISVKTTAGFRDWLARVAESERVTTVQLIEKAVVDYAERRKFPDPAPRRTVGR